MILFFDFSMHKNMFLPGEGLQLKSGGREAVMASLFCVFVISFPTCGGRLAEYNLHATLHETRKLSEFLWNALFKIDAVFFSFPPHF